MDNRYNVWNKWDKLKTVVLGDTYKPEFYKDIKDTNIKDALLKICEETLEDLDYFESVLKDFGCRVLRPSVDPNDNIMNYVSPKSGALPVRGGGVPRPPLFPRDTQFVIGDRLVYTGTERGDHWGKVLRPYNDTDIIELRDAAAKDAGTYHFVEGPIPAPSYTVVGRDLYVDTRDNPMEKWQKHKLLSKIENLRLNYLYHGGHSDGCFHTINNGAILSIMKVQTYEKTFPGWDVCYLPNQSWERMIGFSYLKKKVNSVKWWVPGEEGNDAFTSFVEEWLDNWVGFVEESVFDVNVLVLDEHHVCVNNMNPQVTEFLKKHKMEPVHIPWRHRFFHDGGLHCLTLDLEREGDQEDYFPARGNVGIVDHGFD